MSVKKTRPATPRGTAGRRTSSRRSGRTPRRLKPVRIQLELRSMPGWRLTAGGNALIRTRKLGQHKALIDLARQLG